MEYSAQKLNLKILPVTSSHQKMTIRVKQTIHIHRSANATIGASQFESVTRQPGTLVMDYGTRGGPKLFSFNFLVLVAFNGSTHYITVLHYSASEYTNGIRCIITVTTRNPTKVPLPRLLFLLLNTTNHIRNNDVFIWNSPSA